MKKHSFVFIVLLAVFFFNNVQIFGQELKLYQTLAKPRLTKLDGLFVGHHKDFRIMFVPNTTTNYHQLSPNVIKNLVYLSSYHQYPPQTYGTWEAQPFMGDNYLEVFASIASNLLWNSLDRKIWK
jgi:hypothetical protein